MRRERLEAAPVVFFVMSLVVREILWAVRESALEVRAGVLRVDRRTVEVFLSTIMLIL